MGDAGSGMAEEQQRHLFEPFVKTKGDLGNGLGLYISHEIAERHHGRLIGRSEVGVGTTMTVQLPLPREVEKREPMPYVNARS